MVIGAVVSQMAQEVTGFIAAILSLVQSVLHFNYAVVQKTIDATMWTFNAIRNIGGSIEEFLQVCWSDLDIFLSDGIDWIAIAVEHLVDIFAVAFSGPIRLLTILLTPFFFVADMLIGANKLVMYGGGLVIRTAAMFGLAVLRAPAEIFKLWFLSVCFGVSCVNSAFWTFFSALGRIPLEAYLGLTVTVVIFCATKWLMKRFGIRAVIRLTRRSLKYFAAKMRSACLTVTLKLSDTLRKLRPRSAEVVVGEDVGSDTENSDISVEETPQPVAVPERRLTRAALRRENSVKVAREELNREREAQLCVVCQDERKTVAILPCRHMCLCDTCADALRSRDPFCPMCRGYIRELIQLYS